MTPTEYRQRTKGNSAPRMPWAPIVRPIVKNRCFKVLLSFSRQPPQNPNRRSDRSLPYWKAVNVVAVNKQFRAALYDLRSRSAALGGKWEDGRWYRSSPAEPGVLLCPMLRQAAAGNICGDQRIHRRVAHLSRFPGNWECKVSAFYLSMYELRRPVRRHRCRRFAPEANPVGVYRRDFKVPEMGRRVSSCSSLPPNRASTIYVSGGRWSW